MEIVVFYLANLLSCRKLWSPSKTSVPPDVSNELPFDMLFCCSYGSSVGSKSPSDNVGNCGQKIHFQIHFPSIVLAVIFFSKI